MHQRRRKGDLCPSQRCICQASGAALTAGCADAPRVRFLTLLSRRQSVRLRLCFFLPTTHYPLPAPPNPSHQTRNFLSTPSIRPTYFVSFRMIQTKYCTLTVIVSFATIQHACPEPRRGPRAKHVQPTAIPTSSRPRFLYLVRSLFPTSQEIPSWAFSSLRTPCLCV
jgi:hypothetical protein